jgi:hypothetical protein
MTPVLAARSAPSAGREVLVLVGLIAAAALLYVPLLGYRWDYLGHFATGAGLALVLILVGQRTPLPPAAVAPISAAAVMLLSTIGETLWFSHLFFDWGDIGAGGLGAALVAAWALRNGDQRLSEGPLLPLAVLLVIAGILLRFAVETGV